MYLEQYQENVFNFVVAIVDGLPLLGARKCIMIKFIFIFTVKCRYNAVFGVQEIDRVIAVTAL